MSIAALTDSVFQAAASRDLAAAISLVRDRLADGHPATAILRALAAVQVQVGERWYCDEWSVADEHAATAIVDAALATVEGGLPTELRDGRPTSVVIACPEGEWHALPARLLATELRALGADVVFLGASMPAAHLACYADAHLPDLVALSVSTALSLGAAASAIDALHAAGVPVVVGGPAFGDSERRARALGADGWSRDAAGLLAMPGFGASAAEAAARRRDRELIVLRLQLDRLELVGAAMDALADRIPAMAHFDEHQLARTREDLDYIASFAEASILVDDPSVFQDFVAWLGPLLAARGVPDGAVDASLDVLIEVSDEGPLRTTLLAARD